MDNGVRPLSSIRFWAVSLWSSEGSWWNFADGVALHGTSVQKAQVQLEDHCEAAASAGLKIRPGKSEVMLAVPCNEDLALDGAVIGHVKDFKCLWSMMVSPESDIMQCRSPACVAFCGSWRGSGGHALIQEK